MFFVLGCFHEIFMESDLIYIVGVVLLRGECTLFSNSKMSLICVPLDTLSMMHSSYNTLSWSRKKPPKKPNPTTFILPLKLKTAPIHKCSRKPCGTIIIDLPSPKRLVIYEHYPICHLITEYNKM